MTKQNKAEINIFIEDEAIDVSILKDALKDVVYSDTPLSAEIIIVAPEEIQKLNKDTRNVDSVTDVLSYPSLDGIRGIDLHKKSFVDEIDEDGNLFIGSIAICLERAKEQAEEYGHSLKRELYYLTIHGLLHLLGYDHMIDSDKAQMREKEEQILNKLNITRD